ncbi:MAG: N-substituted formamide deformylase [Fimbriimonadaceae bacterium]|nr:N-substituted formamide deformylase [Fimbriimonadaceae bacterium]
MSILIRGAKWWEDGELVDLRVDDKGMVESRAPYEAGVTDGPRMIDARGKWLLPKFVDSHCHILPMGLDLQKLHLGQCSTAGEVIDAVRDRDRELEPGVWLQAVHYDQTKFPGAVHLSRDDLDVVSKSRPILLRHVNGHASVANSATLAAAGTDDKISDPPGGTYVRDSSGRLTGVLLEKAHEHVTAKAPKASFEEMVNAILQAAEVMSAMGIGTASDMMTGRWDLLQEITAYREAAMRGSPVRFRLYLQWGAVMGPRAVPELELAAEMDSLDSDRCRVAGVKIFADGAIGSATAAIYGRFETDPPDAFDSGQLMYPPERLLEMVRVAHEKGWQIAVHSIGNRSTDLVMAAFSAVDEPSRHRIEHAMILSDDQIEQMARLGSFCTMQPEFLLRFGHSYRAQLGPDRAMSLKRARSVLRAGIPLSFSSDKPIVNGDPIDGIRTAVHRPEGFDPAETVSAREAIRAYTREGSRVNGDGDRHGTLDVGSLGDYQLLDSLPGE